MKLAFLSFPSNTRGLIALALAVLIFLPTLTLTAAANPPADPPSDNEHFLLYRGENGDAVCREATPEEARELDKVRPTELRPINHLEGDEKPRLGAEDLPQHLTIILLATANLEANAPAKAAFIRAAAAWENRINSPVTIYIRVDYGPTNFGSMWPDQVLGSTTSPSLTNVNYNLVRNSLISGADTPAKLAVYNALPANSLPIDNGTGSTSTVSVSASIARAIGLLNPTAQPTDASAQIGFNSEIVLYDFDPSDGIAGTDFESVATHEIGHALGFTSRSGLSNTTVPAVWDFYRFRSGTTSGTFTTAKRIMTIGGPTTNSQYYFVPGSTEVGLSDGGSDPPDKPPFPNNSDGNQSSHWRQQSQNGNVYIGIMDPRIPGGIHRPITDRDLSALNLFGYNSTLAAPPANDNFASAQSIAGCSGSVNGTNAGATRESGEINHLSTLDSGGGTHSVWYRWLAPSTSSVTFTTGGSVFDTVLGVYTGGSVASLNVIKQADDVSSTDKTSSITFNASAGTTYMIAVDGYNNGGVGGDVGSITLNWNISNCAAGLQLMLDQSGPFADQASAVDSILGLRDPFLVVNSANVIAPSADPNTRVVVFVRNMPSVPAASVVVSLVDNNNQTYDITAQDVRVVSNFDFTQVTFRLPSNLPAGTCRIKVVSQGLFSNTATFRIRT